MENGTTVKRLALMLCCVASASAQQIGHTPTIYPAPGTSGVPGSLCWQETRSNGTNKVCATIPGAIASDYTVALPDATGAVGQFLGMTATDQLGWLDVDELPNVVRTSATQLTIGSNCTVSRPCRTRIGATVYEITASATLDLNSGSGTAYIRALGPFIAVGADAFSVTCTGCIQDTDSSFDVETGIPLYTWDATSGSWDATGTDQRTGFSIMLPVFGGTNMTVTHNASQYTVAANLAATWRFTGIVGVPTAAPGSPQNGDVWYESNKFKCRENGATVNCIDSTAGFPLNEIRITDAPYSAANDCSASINTAFSTALAALPTDSGGKKSGIITFPPGCYAVDISSGTAPLLISRAAGYGDVWLVGAGAGNEFAVVGAGTEIKVTGSAPSTDTAVIEFRNALGGGVRNLQVNANGIAKSRILKIRESRFGTIENLQGRRWTSGPGLEFASETGATAGSCHWNISGLDLGDVRDTDDASGILFDGGVNGYSACSNQITHATVIYSKSGSTSYGVKFKYADNNNVTRANVWASDCTAFPCESNFGTGRLNGTRPALTFEQSSFSVQFPHENFFHGSPSAQAGYMVTGVSGTGGNVVDISTNDCASPGIENAGCVPNIRNIWGRTPMGMYGGQAGSIFPHADADFPTYTLNNSASSISSAGRLNFARNGRVRAAIGDDNTDLYLGTSSGCDLLAVHGSRSAHAADNGTLTSITVSGGVATANLTFSHTCTTASRVRISESTTAALNGEYAVTGTASTTISWATAAANGTYNTDGLTIEVAPKKWWSVKAAGQFSPVTDGLTSLGTSAVKPSEIWSQEYFSYTNNAFGTQDNTFEADNQINMYCDAYSASGATDRCGYHMRRSRGTVASPSNVTSGDRMGTIAGWGMVTAGFDAAARIDMYADTVSGSNITSSIRLGTKNAGGSITDWLTIPGSGGATIGGLAFASLPASTNGTILYCTDCTRATTCAGSGSGAFAHRINSAWSCADASSGGTVSSVAMTVPGFMSVSGSPVTTSGTLAVTLANQSANTVFKGPNSGGAAAPTFAALVDADIPDTITASNYCALAGCTMTGAITGATRYDSFSSAAVDHTWQSNTGNINLYIDQSVSDATSRVGLNMRRSRNTVSSPTTLVSGDAVSVIASWGHNGSGYGTLSTIRTFVDTVSGSNMTSSLRFGTTNAGSSTTDWLKIQGDGGLQYLTGTRPTCDSAHRGTTFYVAGGAGVKDTFDVCGKDAADSYAWRAIY